MTLRGDKYETLEEITTRLKGSVVIYDGDPVYVVDVGQVGPGDPADVARVYIAPLPILPGKEYTKEMCERKFITSKKFDLRPFKMGFMNYEGEAVYLSRIPQRQYTQGLKNNTLRAAMPSGKPFKGFGSVVTAQAFVDCIKGKYPSIQEAMRTGASSVALSRDFAFTRDEDLNLLILNYKDVKCGTKDMDSGHEVGFRLSPKFKFLKESLEQARIPAN